jgi:hypothetical protein
MDAFFDLYWNLDQIVGWAETRDPEIVRVAVIPKDWRPRKSVDLLAHHPHDALRVLGVGRDVESELWAASKLKPAVSKFAPPAGVRNLAGRTGRPTYEVYSDEGLLVIPPLSPAASAFRRAWLYASSSDRAIATDLFATIGNDKTRILSHPRLAELASGFAQSIRTYIAAPETHGPPHVFIRELFPTVDYLEHLFRKGRLQAIGNLPNDPRALEITVSDWSGLEIGVGGDSQRMSVWRSGQIRATGQGDFENVRVGRDAILREFPEEPRLDFDLPRTLPTDDDARNVIRLALTESDGFVSQENGAKIVRRTLPEFPKKRAMQLVKELTGNQKPGPKGPRKNRAANRAE